MNSLNIKRKDVTRTGTGTNQARPWQVLEGQYSTMSSNVLYFGDVNDAGHRFYIGYKTSNSYGFFIIAGYDTASYLLMDSIYNDTWRLFKFSSTSMDR